MTARQIRPLAKRPSPRTRGRPTGTGSIESDGKHFHILPASSNLLGIALLIITGLRVANISRQTFADEIALIAAFCFATACLFSYLAIRGRYEVARFEHLADRIFLTGLASLLVSVVVLALNDKHF